MTAVLLTAVLAQAAQDGGALPLTFSVTWDCPRTEPSAVAQHAQLLFGLQPDGGELLQQGYSALVDAALADKRVDFSPCFRAVHDQVLAEVWKRCDAAQEKPFACRYHSRSMTRFSYLLAVEEELGAEARLLGKVTPFTPLEHVSSDAGLDAAAILGELYTSCEAKDVRLLGPEIVNALRADAGTAACLRRIAGGFARLLLDSSISDRLCSPAMQVCRDREKAIDEVGWAVRDWSRELSDGGVATSHPELWKRPEWGGAPVDEEQLERIADERRPELTLFLQRLRTEDTYEANAPARERRTRAVREAHARLARTLPMGSDLAFTETYAEDLVPCEPLDAGSSRVVNGDTGSGNFPTYGLPARFTLKRLVPKSSIEKPTYVAALNFRFVDKKSGRSTEKLQQKMLKKVRGCFLAVKGLLTGPEGERLELRLGVDEPTLPPAPPIEVSIKKTDEGGMGATGWIESADCDSIVHETLHHLGLVDDYVKGDRSPDACFVAEPPDSLMSGGDVVEEVVKAVRGGKLKSALKPQQFRAIIHAGCLDKTWSYLSCARLMYREDDRDRGAGKCSPRASAICGESSWAD